MIIEDLEDRRVPTVALSTGLAAVLASSAHVSSMPAPASPRVNAATADITPIINFLLPPSISSAQAVSANEIDLSWTRVSGSGVIDYQVEYSSNGGQTWTELAATTGLSRNVTGLNPNTSYLFQVDAYNTQAVSNWSASRSATTLAAPLTLTGTSPSSSEIDLSWNGIAGATLYDVEQSQNGGTTWSVVASTTGTTKTFPSVNPGTSYTFRIGAQSGSGMTFSNVLTITSRPAAPTVTATAVSASEIDLSWNGVNGASQYVVQELEQIAPGAIAPIPIEVTPNASTTSFRVTGLSPDTTYSFFVEAFNASARMFRHG